MRDIKFRGRICNGIRGAGNWVYWGLNGTDMIDVIDKETIGQFTGLKDSKGVEIYEGDILKYSIYDEERTGVIKYEDKWAQFYLSTKNKYGVGVGLTSVHSWYYNADDDGTGVEIIGNIYKNPEFLQTTNDPG